MQQMIAGCDSFEMFPGGGGSVHVNKQQHL